MENYQQFYGSPPMLNGTVVSEYQYQTDDIPQMTLQHPQESTQLIYSTDIPYTGYPYYGNGNQYMTPAQDPSTTNYYGHAYMDAMATVPPFYGAHAPYSNGDNSATQPANPYRIPNGVQYWQGQLESQQPSGSAANGLQSTVIQNAPLQPHRKVVVTLRNEKEWMKYSKETNEMFITNNGKPLFPVLMYDVQGLEAQSNYCTSIYLKKMSVGQMKYSEVEKQWEENEKSDDRAENFTEIFSETMSGAAWELRGVSSSRRIKIYNIGNDRRKAAARKQLTDEEKLKKAEEKSKTMIQVNTHARYLPVLRIYKVDSMDKRHLVEEKSFPETEFVTVTEYKNPWISLNKTADNPSTKSEYREKALAQIEKENNSPRSSTSSGSNSGNGSPSGMASGSLDASPTSGPAFTTSRKTRKALTINNPRAAKALKLSESSVSSGARDPSVGYYGSDNSQWSGFNGYIDSEVSPPKNSDL